VAETDRQDVVIRPVESSDEEAWSALYADYHEFYKLPADPSKVSTVFNWILTSAHGMTGLVAVSSSSSSEILGLANFRPFARPSTATVGIYLDDLFVSPNARGKGVASQLLDAVAQEAGKQGAGLVRWITAEDNADARRVYDKLAKKTHWITYEMAPREATVLQ
jgi:GNAT superfamily N-acetyltransferase